MREHDTEGQYLTYHRRQPRSGYAQIQPEHEKYIPEDVEHSAAHHRDRRQQRVAVVTDECRKIIPHDEQRHDVGYPAHVRQSLCEHYLVVARAEQREQRRFEREEQHVKHRGHADDGQQRRCEILVRLALVARSAAYGEHHRTADTEKYAETYEQVPYGRDAAYGGGARFSLVLPYDDGIDERINRRRQHRAERRRKVSEKLFAQSGHAGRIRFYSVTHLQAYPLCASTPRAVCRNSPPYWRDWGWAGISPRAP